MDPIEALVRIVPVVLADPVLDVPLRQRARFEGWFRVELAGALSQAGLATRVEVQLAMPGHSRRSADLAVGTPAGSCLMMLKTVSTNYRFRDIDKKRCNTTENIQEVISDIQKLVASPNSHRGVSVFAAFPMSADAGVREYRFRKYINRISATGAVLLADGFVPRDAGLWGISWYLLEVRRNGQGAAQYAT